MLGFASMLCEKSGVVVLRCASTPVSYKKDNADNLKQEGKTNMERLQEDSGCNTPLFQL